MRGNPLLMVRKERLADLAIFGGHPAFLEALHVGKPSIGNRARLLARLNAMLDLAKLTNDGPYVRELEARLADFLQVRHCIAVCNATVGLEIVIRATGLSGEVVVPSFTFIATAHALLWLGITPVFCDIDPLTHTLDPRKVEALLTPRTTGILGVHVWGRPCDIEALTDIAHRRKLTLVFDAAHALGCSRGGRPVGGFGRAEVFSFHATKFFNSFEGGAVTTNDDELAAALRLMRNFGFAGQDKVVSLGINGKMSEAAAAMGLTSFESLEHVIAVNRRNHDLYRECLTALPGVELISYDPSERHNYQYVVLEIDEMIAGIGRDRLREVLLAENVLARRYFYPGCHRMEPYRSRFPEVGRRVPNTERVASRVLCLPTGTSVGPEEIPIVSQILRTAVGNGPEISRRLSGARVGPASSARRSSRTSTG